MVDRAVQARHDPVFSGGTVAVNVVGSWANVAAGPGAAFIGVILAEAIWQ
ncbi:hypothetical protein ACIBPB_07315 [Micromonospora sp. NPDC049836]